jgi:transposase-like protein
MVAHGIGQALNNLVEQWGQQTLKRTQKFQTNRMRHGKH